ncbi:disulfide bond formation protein B [Candidatus Woesearchaeota archaeon]|nr:disulfide bond formation protein B [Candidatus Woesearchaeota archaeon]
MLETLTFLSHIFIVLFLASFFVLRNNKKFKKTKTYSFFKENSSKIAFIVALAATLGSLFLSEIMGFVPCKLCWIQRIFMYPLPIIMGVALYKKQKIEDYIIPLAVFGVFFSAYQVIIQRVVFTNSIFCTFGSEPCTTIYTLGYGYITYPVMSLTAFVLIIMFSYMNKKLN